MVYDNILQAIGNTPVIRLRRLTEGMNAEVLVKYEGMNVSGSAKIRTALGMIESLEEQGRLRPGYTIVESTTGNQGTALSCIAAVRGYKAIMVMPQSTSIERQKLMRAYGAEIILTPVMEDMEETIQAVRRVCYTLERERPNTVYVRQFENMANPDLHRKTMATEILRDTWGKIDAFVAAVGSGGTITGVGEMLKVAIPHIKVIGAEPWNAALEGYGRKGLHKQYGIGDGQKNPVLNRSIVDRWIAVTDDDAYATARRLAREEGILGGASSGCATFAALQVAREMGGGARVLTILPDTGERYLSTDLLVDN